MHEKVLFMLTKKEMKRYYFFGIFSYLGQNPNFNQKGINYIIYIIFTIYIQK